MASKRKKKKFQELFQAQLFPFVIYHRIYVISISRRWKEKEKEKWHANLSIFLTWKFNSSELNRNFLLCKFCSIVSSEGAKPLEMGGEAAKMKLHGNREGVEQAVKRGAASFEHPGLVFPFRSMHSKLLNNRMTPRRRLGVSLRSIDRLPFFVASSIEIPAQFSKHLLLRSRKEWREGDG